MSTRDNSPRVSLFPGRPPDAGRRDASNRAAALIASPGPSLRNRLKESLQDSCPVHEVSSWEALDRTISSLLPDIALLDANLLAASGIRDLSIIRRISRKTKILVLSANPTAEEAIAGLKAGARGYCASGVEAAVLRKAVEKVREGEIWAERRLIPILIDQFAGSAEDRPARARSDHRLALLTPREREIARWIGAGASNRDIAVRLAVGEGTVKAHLTAIFRKLGFTDRLQLGLYLAGPGSRTRGKH